MVVCVCVYVVMCVILCGCVYMVVCVCVYVCMWSCVYVCMYVVTCMCVCGHVCMCVLQAPTMSAYKDLAEDENLKLTYEMRPNPLYSGQITVGVVFR